VPVLVLVLAEGVAAAPGAFCALAGTAGIGGASSGTRNPELFEGFFLTVLDPA
jgi:hypothetical protein